MLTLFEVSTLELWLEPMYAASDVTAIGHDPVRGSNDATAAVFFLVFVLFSSCFLIQLFASVLR